MLPKISPLPTIHEATSVSPKHNTDKGFSTHRLFWHHSEKSPAYASRILCTLLLFLFCSGFHGATCAQDLDSVVEGFQQRYAAVETVTGDYQHHYRAPSQGIDQIESGVFWFKRPGFMRWECHQPEEQLYVLDGRRSFHYIPLDYQVYVQPLTAADLRNTPLEFLLGDVKIKKKYDISWEVNFLPDSEQTRLIRLTSRQSEPGYSFLVLGLDGETWELKRLIIQESTGNISEFLFSNVKANVKIENSKFRFEFPKGVEVIQLTDNE